MDGVKKKPGLKWWLSRTAMHGNYGTIMTEKRYTMGRTGQIGESLNFGFIIDILFTGMWKKADHPHPCSAFFNCSFFSMNKIPGNIPYHESDRDFFVACCLSLSLSLLPFVPTESVKLTHKEYSTRLTQTSTSLACLSRLTEREGRNTWLWIASDMLDTPGMTLHP